MASEACLKGATLPCREQPVAELAACLEIREIDVFRLAHRWWFGREAEARVLERIFAAYMFRHDMPPWARHYAREVLATGSIDAEAARRLGLERLRGPAPAPRHGRLVVAATAAVFTLLLAAILATDYGPQDRAPPTPWERPPSCAGGGPGLALLENVAYAFAGRDRPPC